MPTPVGEIKRLVSLVDRGDADEYFYPVAAPNTTFLPNFKPYHNFANETVELPYTGAANWGQRITFTLPFPWMGDCLSWISLRFTPNHWLPGDAIQGLLDVTPYRWTYQTGDKTWMWAANLGTSAIALVEMEVNGIVVEQWSGDWIDIWQRVYLDSSRSAGWVDSVVGTINRPNPSTTPTFANQMGGTTFSDYASSEATSVQVPDVTNEQTILPTEDGSVYAHFPFWFARRKNAAFPIASIQGEGNVRFHVTFRAFNDVIRKIGKPRVCDENMLGSTVTFNDNTTTIPFDNSVDLLRTPPPFKDAILMCGFTHLEGELRQAYIHRPHEILIEPVINISFSEPLKYVINTGMSDTITVSLPLEAANGPVREVIWFLRRKANYKFNSWTNYGAYLEDEVDPIYCPQRSLLVKAVLRVGAVVWADQDELWWRSRGALQHPGGIQLLNSYIYAYSFANDPSKFGPTGSMNASRAEMRLDLTIAPPIGIADNEWEVQVFVVSHNWMRFQNGMAERLFTD